MKFDGLIDLIMAYESDTFSGSGSKIKRYEARQVAEKLLDSLEHGLDGVQLSECLDDVRE